VDEIRITPAGDGFYAAKLRPSEATDETSPRGCALCMDSGFVFFGLAELDEDGEEKTDEVPCWRCGGSTE
jgi:hypothetical protein